MRCRCWIAKSWKASTLNLQKPSLNLWRCQYNFPRRFSAATRRHQSRPLRRSEGFGFRSPPVEVVKRCRNIDSTDETGTRSAICHSPFTGPTAPTNRRRHRNTEKSDWSRAAKHGIRCCHRQATCPPPSDQHEETTGRGGQIQCPYCLLHCKRHKAREHQIARRISDSVWVPAVSSRCHPPPTSWCPSDDYQEYKQGLRYVNSSKSH